MFNVCFWHLERFDCDNLRNIREILVKNETLSNELNRYKRIVKNLIEQQSTTTIYEFLRFMPITNMFIHVFGR